MLGRRPSCDALDDAADASRELDGDLASSEVLLVCELRRMSPGGRGGGGQGYADIYYVGGEARRMGRCAPSNLARPDDTLPVLSPDCLRRRSSSRFHAGSWRAGGGEVRLRGRGGGEGEREDARQWYMTLHKPRGRQGRWKMRLLAFER